MKYESEITNIILFLYAIFLVKCRSNHYFILNSNSTTCSSVNFATGRKIALEEQTKIVLDESRYFDSSEGKFLCSGVEITPHGIFVIRKTQRNCDRSLCSSNDLAYFWMLDGSIQLDCSKFKFFKNLKMEIFSWLIDVEGLKAPNDSSDQMFYLHNEPNTTLVLDCFNNKYILNPLTRKISIKWSVDRIDENSLINKDDSNQDFPVNISLYPRLYFRGNLGKPEKKLYCNAFDGFWCGSSKEEISAAIDPNRTSEDLSKVHFEDNDICIKLNLRCDGYSHCPKSKLQPISLDEFNCNRQPVTPVFKQDNESSRWYTKLPWLILAFVPIVLVCALGRICSQKHNLEVLEYDENYDSTSKAELNPTFGTLMEMQDLKNMNNNFHMSVKSLTPVAECREDEECATNLSSETSENAYYHSNYPSSDDALNTIYEEEQQKHNINLRPTDLGLSEPNESLMEIEPVTLRETNKTTTGSSARNTFNSALKKFKNIIAGVGGSSNSSPSDSMSLVDFDYPPVAYSFEHDYSQYAANDTRVNPDAYFPINYDSDDFYYQDDQQQGKDPQQGVLLNHDSQQEKQNINIADPLTDEPRNSQREPEFPSEVQDSQTLIQNADVQMHS